MALSQFKRPSWQTWKKDTLFARITEKLFAEFNLQTFPALFATLIAAHSSRKLTSAQFDNSEVCDLIFAELSSYNQAVQLPCV